MLRLEDMVGQRAALEAIDFQANDPFPKQLSAQFERMFSFVTKWNQDYSVTGEGVEDSRQMNDKYKALGKFFDKEIAPEIKKLVRKRFGIELDAVKGVHPDNKYRLLDVYVSLPKANKTLIEMLAASEGSGDKELSTENASVAQIVSIGVSVDRKAAKIRRSIKMFKPTIGLSLALFDLNDFFHKKVAEKTQPSADEITAAFLHEIGHLFAFFEYGADLSYCGHYGNSVLRKADSLPANELPKEAKKLNGIIQESKSVPQKAKEVGNKIVDFMSTWTDEDEATIPFAARMVMRGLFYWLMGVVWLYTWAIFSPLAAYMTKYTSRGGRNSKIAATAKNTTMHERLADEFVSRFKYGKALNSVLIKIDVAARDLGVATPDRSIRESRMAALASNFSSFPVEVMIKAFSSLAEEASPYETQEVRLRRNIANAQDTLNRHSLPKDVRKEITEDIEIMEQQLRRTTLRNFFFRPVDVYVKIINIFPIILAKGADMVFGNEGYLAHDKKLFDAADRIMSNKAGYFSTKLGGVGK